MKKIEYYSKEIIEVAKLNTQMSPSTWHKIMNPFCGICMAEKGRRIIEGQK